MWGLGNKQLKIRNLNQKFDIPHDRIGYSVWRYCGGMIHPGTSMDPNSDPITPQRGIVVAAGGPGEVRLPALYVVNVDNRGWVWFSCQSGIYDQCQYL